MFVLQRAPSVLNELIIRYAMMVKGMAQKVSKHTGFRADADALFADGCIGLKDAIEKFDPTKGVKFATYAIRRVHGAMLDGLRELDWMPRSARRRDDDRKQLSIDSTTNDAGDVRNQVMQLVDEGTSSTAVLECDETFSSIIEPLPSKRHREIITMYYRDGLTMKEIGEVLDISECRVSQLCSDAIKILRATVSESGA